MLRGSTPAIVSENVRLLKARGRDEQTAIQEAHDHAKKHAESGGLTCAQCERLTDDQFALPNRRYPVDNANRAKGALARVAKHGTPEERRAVRAAVSTRYPDLEADDA